jgi:LysR family transcriptional activator of nhaA
MIVGEFDDSALMQAFGFAGTGIFVAPTALEETLQKEGNVEVIGRNCEVNEHFYAISIERRITHSAIKAITEHAQGWLH